MAKVYKTIKNEFVQVLIFNMGSIHTIEERNYTSNVAEARINKLLASLKPHEYVAITKYCYTNKGATLKTHPVVFFTNDKQKYEGKQTTRRLFEILNNSKMS